MNGMDEWQAIQNEKIRLMEIIETGVAAQNAEIERLRSILRSCVHGAEIVDIGGGELLGLYLPNKSHVALSSQQRTQEG